MLSSFGYATAKTADGLATTGGSALSVDVLIRGIGPILFLTIGYFTSGVAVKRRGISKVEIGLGAFALVCLASTGWSVDPLATAQKAVQYGVTILALVRLSRLYDSVEQATRALVGVIHLLLVVAAVQYVAFPGLTYVPGLYEVEPRLYSLAPSISPNPLAALCVTGLIALLLGLSPRWVNRYRLAPWGLGALILVELLATRTRTAIAIGLVLVAAAGLLRAKRHATLVVFGGLSIPVVALWAWTPERQAVIESFLLRGQTAQNTRTLTGRTYIWDLALDKWADDRLLGFGYYSGHRFGIPGLGQSQSNLDSVWIESLVDVGLFGTVVLAFAMLAGSVAVLRLGVRTPEAVLLQLVAAYGLVASFVNPTIQTVGPGLLLFGLPLLIASLPSDHEPAGTAPRRRLPDHSSDLAPRAP